MSKTGSVNKPVGRVVKAVIWVVIIIVILAIVAIVFSKPLLTALTTGIIKQRFISQSEMQQDGLFAGLAGSGGPFPDLNRASSCVAVRAGAHLYIVDAGDGSARNLSLMGFQLGKVEAVLLTHFHSDHIADLGEIMLQRWVGWSNDKPLEVIGPQGVETVVEGFNLAYKLDDGYRVAHHGEKTVPPSGAGGVARPFNLPSGDDASMVILDKDGVKITAFRVNHAPVSPAVGYRFDYKGRSLVISGDTVPCESLKKQAKGVDVLIHDAMQVATVKLIGEQAELSPSPSLAKIMADIPSYHATPEDAAKIAGEAGVKHLVLYHITPPIPLALLNNQFMGDAARYYRGPITIGTDGLMIGLPPASDRIDIRQALK
jgi:ribonuclease Z